MSDEMAQRILAELAEIKARLPVVASEPNRSLPRKAAAEYLGMHEKTLADLTTLADEPGKVKGYKTGARWKYRVSDLDRYRDQLAGAARSSPSGRERAIDWAQ